MVYKTDIPAIRFGAPWMPIAVYHIGNHIPKASFSIENLNEKPAQQEAKPETQVKSGPEPIYNQPKHPKFPHIRRMHLILLHLFGDELGGAEERFKEFFNRDWTEFMVSQLEWHGDEKKAARVTTHWMLNV